MSSEIYYDRAYIRVGDRFIPVVNHGSSNCFDFDACGREVPEKYWSVLNYTFHGRQLFHRRGNQANCSDIRSDEQR